MDLEEEIWRRASSEVGERTLAEFVTMFEVADCWRFGGTPSPSLERSVFLWHATVGDATLAARAAPILTQRCHIEVELFRAQERALVVAAQNRGGRFARDTLFESPDIPFGAEWPTRFTAHAQSIDRFLLRMPVFRNVRLLDEIGISRVVLGDHHMTAIRTLVHETLISPAAPDWGWHIAAIWTAVATEEWVKDELGAHPGTRTRH